MYIKIKVTAGAGKEAFKKVSVDHFEIAVRQKAEANQANRRVTELVREHFPQAKNIRIVSGHHSPSKILSVE